MVARALRSPTTASFAVLGAALLEWWSRLHAGTAPLDYGSADILAMQSLVEDVVIRGGDYWGAWHVTPAPYFFPDGLFTLVARGLVAAPHLVTAVSAAVQVVVLALVAWFAVRELEPRHAWTAPLVVALVLLLGLDGTAPPQWLMAPVHHTGASVVLLLVSVAGTRFVRTGHRVPFTAAMALLFAGAASDALIATVAAALVVLALSSGATASREHARRARWFAFVGIACTALGLLAARALVSFPELGATVIRLPSVPTSLAVMARTVVGWPLRTQALGLSVVLTALASVWCARRSPLVLWLITGFAMLGSVALTANVADGNWERYVLFLFLSAHLVGAVFLARTRVGRGVLGVLSVAVLLATVRPLAWVAPWQAPGSVWQASVRCVDDLAERERAHVVVTEYWFGKPLVAFSQHGLRAAVVDAKVQQPRLWIVSERWYWPVAESGLVIANGLDATALEAWFGSPSERVACGELQVHVYRGDARARFQRAYAGLMNSLTPR